MTDRPALQLAKQVSPALKSLAIALFDARKLLEDEKPVMAYKVLRGASQRLLDLQLELSTKFPHEL